MSKAARPLKIFIVENHEDTILYMKMFLEQLGHHVEVARDMKTALERIPNAGVDVLISDIGLPDGDGWELLSQLGGPEAGLYAIAMSGFGMNADRNRSKTAGYKHHLIKPFLPEDLESLLAKV